MLCAAIDIGSNTTRLLVAEPVDGQLKKVMEQRAYTRINKAIRDSGEIPVEKAAEVAEVVATQVRLARELGAETIRAVATAASAKRATARPSRKQIGEAAGVPVEILSERGGGAALLHRRDQDARPSGRRAWSASSTSAAARPRSSSAPSPAACGRSAPGAVGSGVLADELIASDPPSAAEIRKIRDRIDDLFADVEIEQPTQAVAVGGSATSLRRLVGAVLEYETLERGVRVLCGDPAADVARRFELDPERVRILATGVLLLEKLSELLGQPLQIGKGGLREGVILDQLNGNANGSSPARLAA